MEMGTVTNSDGQFVLRGLPPGDHTLLLSHRDLGERTARVVWGPGPVPEPDIEAPEVDSRALELPPTGSEMLPPPPGGGGMGAVNEDLGVVTGRVSEEGTGAPIGGVRVSLPGVKIGAVANIHGKFLLFNVPPGTYTLLIEKDGYPAGEMEVVVEAGETSEVDPVLGR